MSVTTVEWTPRRKCDERRERENGIERFDLVSRRWDAVLTALFSAAGVFCAVLFVRLLVACIAVAFFGARPHDLLTMRKGKNRKENT